MLDAGKLIKDLQEMRDEGHLSDALLRKAVRNISEEDRFDWVGVYLLNEDDDELWLHNYIGEPTEHAKIPVGKGVCGRAVEERTNLNMGLMAHTQELVLRLKVDDVSEEENYLACSPDTQSELVVLIRAGDDIFGQIDIDSDEKDTFTEEDEIALIGIADKLAEQMAAERRDAS